MKLLVNPVLLAALLGLPATLSAQIQFCITDCQNFCNSDSYCDTECTLNCDTPSTCGEYGICNPDPDGDGLTFSDNCPFSYNPDQADCDGDGSGDVCDSEDGTYNIIGETIRLCLIVGRLHFGYVDVQGHFEAEFSDVSACGSPNKWKEIFVTSRFSCIPSASVSSCCERNFGSEDCFYYLNRNTCQF